MPHLIASERPAGNGFSPPGAMTGLGAGAHCSPIERLARRVALASGIPEHIIILHATIAGLGAIVEGRNNG